MGSSSSDEQEIVSNVSHDDTKAISASSDESRKQIQYEGSCSKTSRLKVSEITTPTLGSGIPRSREVPNTVNSLTIHPIRSTTIDGITEDNQCAQNDTKSQQLSRNIDVWLISIEDYNIEGTTKKPRVERVPPMLRAIESKKECCFDPLIVSIGPYHHNKSDLLAFETWKLEYAKQFVHDDCGDQVLMKDLIAEVVKVVDDARQCYEEGSTKDYDDESFIIMMFLDGCFVLHFMRMFTGTASYDMKKSDVRFVIRDLFLLDNQIPLLILQVLMSKSEVTSLIQNFLNKLDTMAPPHCPQETSWLKLDDRPHLLDLRREYLQGPKRDCDKGDSSSDNWNPFRSIAELISAGIHFRASKTHHVTERDFDKGDSSSDNWNPFRSIAELISAGIHFRASKTHHVTERDCDKGDSSSDNWNPFRSIAELRLAGIHFRKSNSHHVTDVHFKPHLICGGTVMLPPIVVDDSTKSLYLNLVAYEMSPSGPKDMCISSYIGLMDSLIDNPDDVKELRKQGILLNDLGSDEQLAQLFNEIADGVVVDPNAYKYIECMIEKQCKNKIQVWIAEWMHNHFRSPWTVLALLGALLVLALTIVQTYIAITSRG